MKRRHLLLALLASFTVFWLLFVAAPALAPSHFVTIQVLDQPRANLSDQQIHTMLASPDAKVRISYYPSLEIPGITAKTATCGFLMWPCWIGEPEEVEISANALEHPQPASLRFSFKPALIRHGVLYRASPPSIRLRTPESDTWEIRQTGIEIPPHGEWQLTDTSRALYRRLALATIRYDTEDTLAAPGKWRAQTCDEPAWISTSGSMEYQPSSLAEFYDQIQSEANYRNDSAVQLLPSQSLIKTAKQVRAAHAKGTVDGRIVESIDFRLEGYTTAAGACDSFLIGRFSWVDGQLVSARLDPDDLRNPACSNDQLRLEHAQWWLGQLEHYMVLRPEPSGGATGYTWRRRWSPYDTCIGNPRLAKKPVLDALTTEAAAWRQLFAGMTKAQ